MSGDGPILVFLGPTLPVAKAADVIDAVFLRPVAQGDVLLAAHAFRPRAMVLIDGHFEDRPAVRHKEILWAMAQGITVIGAASMGALRAAELYPFGMIGVGLIYRWYRRWPLAPDDAVAVHSAPPELGFLPLTDSMVDLQRTFSGLMRSKRISPEERDRLTRTAGNMSFRDRSLDAVLGAVEWPADSRPLSSKEMVRQKQRDALLALHMAPGLVRPPARRPWVATNTFIRDLIAGGIDIDLLNTYA